MAKAKKLKAVKSLRELKNLAATDERYAKLLHAASENLGGMIGDTLEGAYRNLINNANETDEKGVVGEVNFVRDLV